MSDASKYASQRVFDGKRLLSAESVAKLRVSYERPDAMSDDKDDTLRAALEHIKIVCEDNEACGHLGRSLALKFVLGIAERALLQPASEG